MTIEIVEEPRREKKKKESWFTQTKGFSIQPLVGVWASGRQGCLLHRWREDEERKPEGKRKRQRL